MSRSKGWKMWRSKEILEEEEIETVTDKLIIRNKSTPNTVDRVPISPCLLGPSSGRDRTVIRSAKITLFPQAGEESDPDRFRDTYPTHHSFDRLKKSLYSRTLITRFLLAGYHHCSCRVVTVKNHIAVEPLKEPLDDETPNYDITEDDELAEKAVQTNA